MFKNISLFLLCAFLFAVTISVVVIENRCSFGKFGNNCSADCDCNLNGSTGNCSFWGQCSCVDGYWGYKCQRKCDSHCLSNKCDVEWGGCICRDFRYGMNCDNGKRIFSSTIVISLAAEVMRLRGE
ncbi:protein draper-like [Gordionus sp. m RMFG-2023]|uniref:protein draper-like n=1 Tax=Gordionus sp. m RMFG-2023 TaxID=3053472 RepID=UPI0031FCE3AB